MTEQRSYLLALVGVMAVVGIVVALQPTQAVPIIGFGTLIAVALLQLLQGQKAAIKVEEVASTQKDAAALVAKVAKTLQTAEGKVDKLALVAEATHTLVNSAMGNQLQISALLARRLSTITGESGDISAAVEAERLYDDHIRKQAVVDAKPLPRSDAS